MFSWLNCLIRRSEAETYLPPQGDEPADNRLKASLSENMLNIRRYLFNSSDLVNKPLRVGECSLEILTCDGMINTQTLCELLIEPLTSLTPPPQDPSQLIKWIRTRAMMATEQKEVYTYAELFQLFMSGFAVILVDGVDFALCFGVQGYNFRSISEPSSEVNVRGSREGFVEPVRVNMSMIRRRIKSPVLKFDLFSLGSKSRTDVCMVYMTDRVSQDFVQTTRRRLEAAQLDLVLESSYIQPYLEKRPLSFFSGIGTTERPDTVCAKINEGRIVILVDGTPFALILPYLFNENFQSIDDYTHRPYYAAFIRLLKYAAFFFTILLPGLYVAISSFHPELLPHSLLYKVAAAEKNTPFSLLTEALLIHLIYEIMREAGLRLPRPVGHAVGIVGALVIGDAAVTAGLVGSPMVMVVALTAISSFVVPSLYDSVTVLKFLFILAGGLLGLFGITLGLSMLLVNLCSVNIGGIPTTAPTTPFSAYAMRDIFIRAGWKTLNQRSFHIEDVPGSEMGEHKS